MKRYSFLLVVLIAITACSAPAASPSTMPTVAPVTVTPGAIPADNFVASDPALVARTGRPQMVEFFAFWCTDCQGMRPLVHALQKDYEGKIDFLYLDIDAQNTKPLQHQLTFTGLRPTIIFMDAHGHEVTRLVGVHGKQEIQNHLDDLLKNSSS